MESIKLDGNVANVRKTYANTYQIFVHLDISWILLYFPYVFPGAIYLARYSTPRHGHCKIRLHTTMTTSAISHGRGWLAKTDIEDGAVLEEAACH